MRRAKKKIEMESARRWASRSASFVCRLSEVSLRRWVGTLEIWRDRTRRCDSMKPTKKDPEMSESWYMSNGVGYRVVLMYGVVMGHI